MFARYVKKVQRIGFVNAVRVLNTRLHRAAIIQYWRFIVLRGKAPSSWQDIADYEFVDFFERTQSNFLFSIEIMSAALSADFQALSKAEDAVNRIFSVLDSVPAQYDKIPWHTDIRLLHQDAQADAYFNSTQFYADIKIECGKSDQLVKDIKVPWELSRCQHFLWLGHAYVQTYDACYAKSFAYHVTDWFDANPFLFGVNWVNPMEVALRAINWIIAYEYFKYSSHIPILFWQRFFCSLYDHMRYLEHNWEFYDSRTNNHYLSNLVGYLYLVLFFKDLPGMYKKRNWVLREIIKETKKQIFADGTSYEGSTAYHGLVTELLLHTHMVCKQARIELDHAFLKQLRAAINFVQWVRYNDYDMVKIGDDDSGSVLAIGLQLFNNEFYSSELHKQSSNYFPNFGISIIKYQRWHITLRHHRYEERQPTAHFHQDMASITLAIDGIPIIIDPGSFVYTPSAVWRNYFRSASVHNGCIIGDNDTIKHTNDLFELSLPVNNADQLHIEDENSITICTRHDLYARYGVQFKRELLLNKHVDQIMITDSWHSNQMSQELSCTWNFTLAPDVTATIYDNYTEFTHISGVQLTLTAPKLTFTKQLAWVSTRYGQKVASHALRGSAQCIIGKQIKVGIHLL